MTYQPNNLTLRDLIQLNPKMQSDAAVEPQLVAKMMMHNATKGTIGLYFYY